MRVGTIIEVWRYPVKSMGGERLTEPASVGARGIEGDRARAVVDTATGKVLSAKTVPQLLQARARWVGDGEVRVVADGLEVADLAWWLGRPVRLVAPVEGERATFDMDLDPDDASEVVELQTPPGSFFDSRSTLHLLTTASLGTWDVRRFRPNLVVATNGGVFPEPEVPLTDSRVTGTSGEPEDGWIGRRVRLGASVEAIVRKATSRCVVTTRAQPGLAKDSSVYRHLLRTRDGNLGVYLDPQTSGTVGAGDAVELVA